MVYKNGKFILDDGHEVSPIEAHQIANQIEKNDLKETIADVLNGSQYDINNLSEESLDKLVSSCHKALTNDTSEVLSDMIWTVASNEYDRLVAEAIFQKLKEDIETAKVHILFKGREEIGGNSSGLDIVDFYITSPPNNEILGSIALGSTQIYIEYKSAEMKIKCYEKEFEDFEILVKKAYDRDDSMIRNSEKLLPKVLDHWVKGNSYTREDYVRHIQVNLLLEKDFKIIEKAAYINWDEDLADKNSIYFYDKYDRAIANPFIEETGRFPLDGFEKSLEYYGETNVYLFLYDLFEKYDLPLLFKDTEFKNLDEEERRPVLYNDEIVNKKSNINKEK